MDEVKEKKHHILPGFIRNDMGRKLIAFCFACVVVLLVRSQQTDSRSIRVANARFVFDKGNYVFADPESVNYVPEVIVSVSSTKRELDSLKPDEFFIDIPVDAKIAESVSREINTGLLSTESVRTPKNVSVQRFVTSRITVPELEKIVRKSVPVEAVYDERELPADYRVESVSFVSADTGRPVTSVDVIGTERNVARIHSVRTRAIPLRDMTVPFEFSASLSAFPRNDDVKTDLSHVTAKVKVSRDVYTEVIHNVPVMALANPQLIRNFNVTALNDVVEITVRGMRRDVTAFMAAYRKNHGILSVFVDISEMKKGDGSETPRSLDVVCATSFPGVSLLATPQKVKFKIY